ncbi:MAG: hypothetical protein HYY10_02455 [Candidatus Liptonbacteria bacterium]|nr:hypothetical protein [Candidatus Liptonbacteria bacterium]
MKRFLYLFIILAAIGLVVAAGFFLQYRSEPAPQQPEAQPAGDTLPIAPSPSFEAPPAAQDEPAATNLPEPVFLGNGLRVLSPRPTYAFAVRTDGSLLLASPDGTISELRGATLNTLSPTVIADIQTISFSFDASKILAVFGDRSEPQVALFDVKSKTWQPFPAAATSAAWSPNDLRVAYLSQKSGAVSLNTLNIADAKAKPQELTRVRFADVTLAWNNPDQILLQERASGLVPTSAWNWDTKKKALVLFAEDQRGFETRWAPGAANGLAFVAGERGYGGSFLLVSPQGDVRETFSFLTFPEKCAFGSMPIPAELRSSSTPSGATIINSLRCAVPRDSTALASVILPDTYRKRAIFTVDDFYEIDLATGATRTILADPGQTLDAMKVAASGDMLYFVNRYDQKLYSLQIK